MRLVILTIWLCLFPFILHAQDPGSTSRKAIKRFEEAVELVQRMDRRGAEEALLHAIRIDDEFLEAYQLLAQIYYEQNRIEVAISYYARTLEIDPDWNPEAYRLLAGMLCLTGAYDRALDLLDQYFAYPGDQLKNTRGGEILQEKCRFALLAMEHPVPFKPENLGQKVNSELSEYWPALSVDESMLMFTVMLPTGTSMGEGRAGYQEDFFVSYRDGDSWVARENAGRVLNTPDNEGAHCLTADGKTLFFTACNRSDGQGMCDIYISTWKEGAWTSPRNLGPPVNTGYSEKHPTVSADGRILFFATNRPGGKGSYDIWRSDWNGTSWTTPVNLGDSVNTNGVDLSPFLHPDGQTLYFSSTGWPGMGRGDLFLTRFDQAVGWSSPRNLGYPINTFSDEIGLTVNARGDRAFFASDRGSGTDTDIYTFELPVEARPVLVSYVTGRVFDKDNMKGLNAAIQLIDLQSGSIVVETGSSVPDGDYLVTLPTDRDYALNVSSDGYLFYSQHFSFEGEHRRTSPFRKDVPMARVEVGTRSILHNVFFDVDSDKLLPASVSELDKVVQFLMENPQLEAEVGGHTDNTGTTEYNDALSRKRALAVVKYLTGQGIDPGRLEAKGYGASEPVAGNDTEEERSRNRRTELKISSVGQ
jgi:outer membrane protein OmpA-like peptidoglycan-associated protein